MGRRYGPPWAVQRATQTVRTRAVAPRHLHAGTNGSFALSTFEIQPSIVSAETLPDCRSQAAVPSLSFCPLWQIMIAGRP